MKLDIQIKGGKELEEMLKLLPAAAAGRIATSGLRAGGAMIREEARRRVPVDTGELRKGIKSIVRRQKAKDRREAVVTVVGKEAPLTHLIEYGTSAHKITAGPGKTLVFVTKGYEVGYARSVQHPGSKAQPFLRPAAVVARNDAVQAITDAMGPALIREAIKLAKRRG